MNALPLLLLVLLPSEVASGLKVARCIGWLKCAGLPHGPVLTALCFLLGRGVAFRSVAVGLQWGTSAGVPSTLYYPGATEHGWVLVEGTSLSEGLIAACTPAERSAHALPP